MVPVPLHWRRRLRRGFNQSELLCSRPVGLLRRPALVRLLYRRRATAAQSELPADRRGGNVRGAFGLSSTLAPPRRPGR
jgi:predicted amidophosphoribosyltransferase